MSLKPKPNQKSNEISNLIQQYIEKRSKGKRSTKIQDGLDNSVQDEFTNDQTVGLSSSAQAMLSKNVKSPDQRPSPDYMDGSAMNDSPGKFSFSGEMSHLNDAH